MEHEEALRLNMTEQYLLDELSRESREGFEEHFFDCRECGEAVRAGTLFIENSSLIFSRETEAVVASTPVTKTSSPWLAWLRPAFAAPALAVLLAFAGFQQYEIHLASRPSILTWIPVHLGTFGSDDALAATAPGQGVVLLVMGASDGSYSRYSAELSGPDGRVESLPLPAAQVAAGQSIAVQIPGTGRRSGTYTLVVRGFNAAGESKEVGRKSFEWKQQ